MSVPAIRFTYVKMSSKNINHNWAQYHHIIKTTDLKVNYVSESLSEHNMPQCFTITKFN